MRDHLTIRLFWLSGTWPVASTVTDGDPFPGRNVHPLGSSQTFGPPADACNKLQST